MPDLLESCIPQALYQEVPEAILYQEVPEVVLLEPLGTDDLLEAPTEHTLLQLGDDHTLLEPVETLVLLTECTPCIPRSGGAAVGIFVTGVLPVAGIVGGREYVPGTAPPNTVLSRAVSDADEVDVVVLVEGPSSFYSPAVKIGGVQAVVTQTATTRVFTAVARITLEPGDNVVRAEMEGGGSTTVLIERAAAGPAVLGVAFGPYPGAQTALKAGDVVQVTITTDPEATSVTVAGGGANGAQLVLPVINGVAAGAITVGSASGAQALYVTARNSLGTDGDAFASAPLALDQTYPTIAAIAPNYPLGQGGFGAGQSGTFTAAASGFDAITYASGDFTIDAPTAYAPTKAVELTGTGYAGSGANLTITATRAANGAVTVRSGLLKFATTPATAAITIQGNPARLVSSPSGQDYVVLLQPDQELLTPPLLSASLGAWQGSWTLSGGVWRRTLRITDAVPRGAGLFSGLVLTGLSGITGTAITSGSAYTVGGMAARTVTFPAFSRVAPLGAPVALAAQTSARITGGAVLTRYDDAGVRSNGYFIADAFGAYNPVGAYLGLSDAAFAGANTTGGLTAEFSEVA